MKTQCIRITKGLLTKDRDIDTSESSLPDLDVCGWDHTGIRANDEG